MFFTLTLRDNFIIYKVESKAKFLFMLNSNEHEISTAHKKTKTPREKREVSCFQSLNCCIKCILLINVKMPTIVVGILTFIGRIFFVLS